MSKFRGVKKTLAVFMAALMVMSCWVFTPIASAVDSTDYTYVADTTPGAGKYWYKVTFTTGSKTVEKVGNYTQWASNMYGKYNYGVGGENTEPQRNERRYNELKPVTPSHEYILFEEYGDPGWFPSKIDLKYQFNALRGFSYTVSVYVGSSSTSELTCIYTSDAYSNSSVRNVFHTLTLSDKPEYSLPALKSVTLTGNNAAITVPKSYSEETVERNFSTAYYDQYGVQLVKDYYTNYVAPTYCVTTTAPTTANEAIYGTVPSGCSINSDGVLSVTSDAQILTKGSNDKTVYVSAVCGDTLSNVIAVRLDNPYYTYSFNTDGGVAVNPISRQYGEEIGTLPVTSKEGYTFTGWFNSNDIQLKETDTVTSDITWTAKYTINKYNLKFNFKDDSGKNISTEYSDIPYGQNITDKIPTLKEIVTTDYTWTPTGWNETPSTTMPAGHKEYTAQYTETKHYADLTELNKQIARANEIKATDCYKEGGYVSTEALDGAYTIAKQYNAETLKSMQSDVDNAANVLKDAIDGLTVREVTITFMDKTGAILKDGYYRVAWGTAVTVPSDPEIDDDLSYHYDFKGWQDSNGNTITYEDLVELCKSVKADTTYYALFKAEEHTWKTETIASTCTSDGATKHTCTVCGYTYSEANGDAAHHTWTDGKVTVKEATCHSEGIKARQCTECGVYQKDSIESIDKLDHSYGDWAIYVEDTCTGKGVKYRECTNEGCGAREYQEVDEITNHQFGPQTTVAATCETDGYTIEKCEDCGIIQYTVGDPATGHIETTETVGATCTKDGYTRTYCTECGKETAERTTVSHQGHDYGDWTPVVPATCGQSGVKVHECTVCNAIEYDMIPQLLEHNYVDVVTSPTCTSQGYTTHTCSACNYSYVDSYTNALDHDMQNVAAESKAATCTSPSVTVEKCSRCDYKTVQVGDKTLGHIFETVEEESAVETCGQSGYATMKCKGCGLTYVAYTESATGNHDWTYATKQEGTKLTVTATCSVCGAEAETTTTVAEGHNYSDAVITKQPTCSATGTMKISCDKKHDASCTAYIEVELAKNEKAHSGETTTATIDATCTQTGTATTVCNDCGEKIAEYEIPAKGHSYDYKSEVQGTCQTEGKIVLKCSCGDTQTITTSVNEGAHNFVNTGYGTATCTTPAYAIYECKNEGCTAKHNRYLTTDKAKGHTWGEPTVTQNGNLITVTRNCTACPETETVIENYEIDLGHKHDFANGTVTVAANATCGTEGKITVACADENCDEVLTINLGKNTNAHTDIETQYIAATCTNAGAISTKCKDCDHEFFFEQIPVLAHEYTVAGKVTKEETCEEDGKQTYKCATCEATTEVTIPKLGHSYKEVTSESKAATCTTYGWTAWKCDNCPKTYNELIKESGHEKTRTVTTKTATCTEDGYTEYYCAKCNSNFKEDIVPATGHDYKHTVVEATCTSQGYTLHECQNGTCGHSYKDSYTPLADHKYTDTVTNPTCTEKGYTTHTCECGYSYIDSYVDATGHKWSETGEKGTDPDGKECTKYPCENGCGEFKYEYVGDGCTHSNATFIKTVKPTCTEVGYDVYFCETCQEEVKLNYVDALGHNYSYWRIVKYPTPTENGLQKRYCQNEGCKVEQEEEIIYGEYYLVTFYNYDGTRVIAPAYYKHGMAANRPKQNPIKMDDTGYTYEFNGWNYSDAEIDNVTKTMAIIAEYTATERVYDTVTYYNADKTVLYVAHNVPYSQMSNRYVGATPTKASDEYYTYTFSSWTIDCDVETGTATAKPEFDSYLKDIYTKPDEKPGIFTKLIEWIKKMLKKYFGFEF